ncbi:serine hydrolase domain-containing protein [Chryseobacterium balustinum]|uniref:CubicO group peptidase, beta-lactamase class C family n=1 Tax=Chryseobacterium balustinum TaxID=246 RepID=A0ABY1L8Q7_9FLAO|nr:serine hydrolase domain-containing protein [Chryseobacterium balustinum]AZB29446.1 class A beta-lactamase-related serine hydrolase [Chryseobacterium balustinum]SKB75152.1 CubicO group peptidase, beta-lactamase class C family [Chryseobacterium balustinum]
MKKLLLSFCFILFTHLLFGQNFAEKVDRIIQTEFNEKDGPGGVFLISKKGKHIYEKAFGLSNLELNVKLQPNNVFQIGSMTKQFTAVAILLLEQDGKLNTSDYISKYIPDYPNGNKISIHNLLTHTSGIKDFTKAKGLSEIAQKEMTPKMMVDFFKNEPVDFQPGEKLEYNNSGYVVLGYIIELVSGKTYEDFIQLNIFDKIGMSNSYYATDRRVIKNRASGYHQKSYGYVNKSVISFSVPYASGSLMSTLEDMLKWQNSLNKNLLLNQKETAKAFTKYKLNNGEEFEYGYGWHLKNINGIPTREHGGSIFGFKSMAVYIPSEDIYVLGFSNCDCNSPTQIVKDIAELALKDSQK